MMTPMLDVEKSMLLYITPRMMKHGMLNTSTTSSQESTRLTGDIGPPIASRSCDMPDSLSPVTNRARR